MNFQSVLQFTFLFVTLFACFVHAATIEHNLVGDNATKERTLRFSLDNLKFTWSGGANYEMVVISEETFNKEGSNVNCALLDNHSLLGFEDSYVSGDIVEFAQPGIYYFRLRSKTSEECYSGSSPDPRLKVILATNEPTNTPTTSPTRFPTKSPTAFPTTSPTSSPTSPTPTPTYSPVAPTHTPTSSPTAPTHSPSASPTAPTGSPTVSPTAPTGSPTSSPTSSSTVEVTNKNNTVSESFPTVGVALGSITAVVLFAGIVVATVAAKKNDQSPDTVSSLACACCVREKRSRRHTDPAEVAQRKTKAVTRKKKKKYKIRFGKKKQKSKVSEFKIGEINIKHESFDHPVRIISGSNRKKQQDAMFPFLFGSNFDDDDPDAKALKELMMAGTNLPSDTETDDPVDLEAQLVSLPNGEEGTKASSQVVNRAPSWFEELIQDADHGEEAAKALSDVASFHSSSTRVVSDEHEDAKRKRVAEENRKGLDSTDRRSLVLFLKEQDKVPLPQDPIHRIDRIAGRYSKEDLVRPLQRLYGKIPDKWKFGSSLRRASKGDASAGNTLDAKLNKEAMGQNALPELVVSTRRPSL